MSIVLAVLILLNKSGGNCVVALPNVTFGLTNACWIIGDENIGACINADRNNDDGGDDSSKLPVVMTLSGSDVFMVVDANICCWYKEPLRNDALSWDGPNVVNSRLGLVGTDVRMLLEPLVAFW